MIVLNDSRLHKISHIALVFAIVLFPISKSAFFVNSIGVFFGSCEHPAWLFRAASIGAWLSISAVLGCVLFVLYERQKRFLIACYMSFPLFCFGMQGGACGGYPMGHVYWLALVGILISILGGLEKSFK